MSSKSIEFPFKLPVDEDDYLMPSPGPIGQSSGYMDLIGDAKLAGIQMALNKKTFQMTLNKRKNFSNIFN